MDDIEKRLIIRFATTCQQLLIGCIDSEKWADVSKLIARAIFELEKLEKSLPLASPEEATKTKEDLEKMFLDLEIDIKSKTAAETPKEDKS